MTIDHLIDAVIDREGGYVDHPADRGGATRYGITEAVARANGYTGDMRSFPRDAAAAIYRRLYWPRPGFDRVADARAALAAELFDTGVNMGPAVATGFLQRALNALNRGATRLSRHRARRPHRPRDARRARRLPRPPRRGGRDGAAQGDRGAPGRTLRRARRDAAPPTKPSSTAGSRTASAEAARTKRSQRLQLPITSPISARSASRNAPLATA